MTDVPSLQDTWKWLGTTMTVYAKLGKDRKKRCWMVAKLDQQDGQVIGVMVKLFTLHVLKNFINSKG